MPVVLVTYKFDGAEHKVVVKPHGNSISKSGYVRRMQSVKKNLKEALQSASPKEAIDKVLTAKGGLLQAMSAGQLPLSDQQAYNIKHTLKAKDAPGPSRGKGRDLLYSIMEQCKAVEKGDRYVQEVTCAPEPMAVLATAQQLLDLERFCCDPCVFSIMGVDPTFNLGEFSVTPIVYQHLMVVDRKTGKSPWMLGPILVHYRKEFRNYNFYFSSLVGLRRGLADIKAAGTDGERSLIEALRHQFHQVILLRCFRHLQKNIERYLQAKGFPPVSQILKQYILDIFGSTDNTGTHHMGLVDCQSEDQFHAELSKKKDTWDKREKDVFGAHHQPSFHTWFVRNKSEDFCEGALKEDRELAGLGSPPSPYYTNSNESINSALKRKVNFTKQQWPDFNDSMKEFVGQQQREVEKAIVGGGKFVLRATYNCFEVNEAGKWWKMTEEQRKLHLRKFHQHFPGSLSSGITSRKGKERKSTTKATSFHSTPKLNEAPILPGLPQETIRGIWSKANSLLATPGSIVQIPGGGPKDRFVLSTSGSEPHAVRSRSIAKRGYTCSDRCLHFKSISICSHVVAVGFSNGDLEEFLEDFKKSQGSPNLFQLSKHGMPPGAGNKGGCLPRRKSKVSTVPTQSVNMRLPPDLNATPPVPPPAAVSSATLPAPPPPAVSSATPPAPPPPAVSSATPPAPLLPIVSFATPPTPPPTVVPTTPAAPPPLTVSSVIPPILPSPITYSYAGPPRLSTPSQLNQLIVPNANPPILQPIFPSPGSPFKVIILHGNITICSGCHQRFPRKSSGTFEDPPYDLAVQHFEDRYFTSPQTGLRQAKKGNAYYHAYSPCILTNWPNFTPNNLLVEDVVRSKLQSSQKALLYQNFGLII